MRIRLVLVAALCTAAGGIAGCGGGTDTAAPESTTTSESAVTNRLVGVLATVDDADTAFTYEPEAAPVGAELELEVSEGEGTTTVRLDADRLQPDRGYAVHAHTDPCGKTGADAGPHYQHQVDPNATPDKPSTDPAYANPRNEIWLDLKTDGQGNGSAETTVPFDFGDRVPASIVLHEKPTTATEPGQAGTAGGRLACFTAPFRD
ncbi:superoxide dismutase family protein [Saccharothrix syringae]|uniref:Superoxide dismutase family protein n=1 Tax=Saccharothrix syringae TaxID=103733 RepID=A0A5Q0H0I9_SACSY|nr:superoxide dismutase family protein [Saccharothrix syringae]QFZ19374.1 superoxide dismutase family protein [Saccharothrix syringae]